MTEKHIVPNEWQETTLEKIVSFSTEKICVSLISPENYVSTENMQADLGGIYKAKSLPQTQKFNFYRKTDTLFSNIRTYFKKVWFSNRNGGASPDILIFRSVDPKVIDPIYLYYILSSQSFIDYTVLTSKGAKMPRGDKAAIMKYEIKLPKIDEQKTIAGILGALDEKIELNRQMNATLEAMARALFKSWFVDFDPVRAKMEGKQPFGMDAATAALFPSRLVPSPLGDIPEGWEIKKFGNIIKPQRGKSITKKMVVEGDVPVVAGGLEPAYYHSVSNANAPVITISASGANAGFIHLYHENIWASDCSYINKIHTPFIYSIYVLLKSKQEELYSMQQGAAQPHIYPSDIMRLDVVTPPVVIWKMLEGIISPYFEKIASNILENKSLEALRNYLLPKLISGELQPGISL